MPLPTAQRPVPGDTLAELYRAHYAFVRRSAYRLGVARAQLDDAVQDVFVVLHRRREQLDLSGAGRALLFGITRRVAKAYRTRAARPRLHVVPAAGETDDGGVQQWEAAEVVHRFLAELPEDKRDIFILAELEGMAASEISEALGGINVNTVYTRLRDARLRFKRVIARHRARERRQVHGQ